jgi:hypothetical protein
MRRTALAAALLALSLPAAGARADSTPVGPLPKGPVTTVTAERGTLVGVALPPLNASSGLVWRVARKVDARVLRIASEGEVGRIVVVILRAHARGRATVHFAATRGESSSKAVRVVTYRIQVT